ncbi:hypothetical protein FNB79_05550 [Formosa sediminum]|uniref:Uncharacterized protein n=1 Tax=Formosa sediminum TaxID=2594004 RepID=A0A516GPP3_9FLAO|nr:hypothetical protein [Formosa sediminum]QDO93463.1 hypothetical protein FNB79_05550 [Formosa sediminum]
MKNLKKLSSEGLIELSQKDLKNIDGGNWIYDVFHAFGVGCVDEGRHGGSVGALKYGGAWNY